VLPTVATAGTYTFGTEYSGGHGAYMIYSGYYTTFTDNGVPYAYLAKVAGATRRPNPNWVSSFVLYGAVMGVSKYGTWTRSSSTQHSGRYYVTKPSQGGTTGERYFYPTRRNIPWVNMLSSIYVKADFDVANSSSQIIYSDVAAPWVERKP
jgi:hypothetical protein